MKIINKFNIPSPTQTLPVLWQGIPRNIKVAFFTTFIAGILVHGYMFANLFLNHDGLHQFLHMLRGHVGATLSSGRWFQNFAIAISGPWPAPWTLGLISSLFISIAACAIVACLEIKRTFIAILIGLILVTFPTTAMAFSYMYVADGLFLSVLLACLAAYVSKTLRFGFILGGMLLALALGIYQAQLAFTSGLFIAMLIIDALKETHCNKAFLLKGVKYFGCLIIGLILYFSILHVMLERHGMVLTSYMNINQMGRAGIAPVYEYYRIVIDAYRGFFDFFTNHQYWFLSSSLLSLRNFVFMVPVILIPVMSALILLSRPKATPSTDCRKLVINVMLLTFLVCIFPLALNLVYFMLQPQNVYILTLYQLSLVFFLVLALTERLEILQENILQVSIKKSLCSLICWISILIFVLIPYNYFVVINGSYLKADLAIRQTQQYSAVLLQRLREFPGFEDDMRVVFVGNRSSENDIVMHAFAQHRPAGWGWGMWPWGTSALINSYGYGHFFHIYMGENVQIQLPFVWDRQEFFEPFREELQELTIFPAQGSMMIIDGILFIRMSEEF